MLTLKNCAEHIYSELNRDELDPSLSPIWLVNEAGHALANARGWVWMQRWDTLDITGGQAYVDLSGLTSFRGVIKAQVATGYLRETDFGAIQDWRQNGVGSSSFPTYYAVVPNTTAAGVVSYRMELWGTPSGSVTDGLSVYYQGGFQPPQTGAETDRIAVPDWMEPLFVTFLRAVAKGRVEQDQAAIEQRIDSIKASSLFQDAVRRDSVTQQNFGQVRNGAVAMQMQSFPTRRMPSSV